MKRYKINYSSSSVVSKYLVTFFRLAIEILSRIHADDTHTVSTGVPATGASYASLITYLASTRRPVTRPPQSVTSSRSAGQRQREATMKMGGASAKMSIL